MKKRLIGALFVLTVAIPMYLIGGKFFMVLSGLLAILAYKELVFIEKYPKIPVIIGLITLLGIIYYNNILFYMLLSLILILIIFYKDYDSNIAFRLIGIIILLGTSFNVINTYMLINKHVLLYLVLITMINDTFAYLIGSRIGKHKFSKISPNKTIEGVIAGIIFGFIVGFIYYLKIVDPNVNIIYLIIMTLILNISVIIGDIMFSKIKREHNIKDYSNLIPGHGGILDRLDSLIVTSIVYAIISLL